MLLIQDGKVLGWIMLVAIQGDKCRLGFQFPTEVIIHRKEIWDEIQQKVTDAADGVEAGRPE